MSEKELFKPRLEEMPQQCVSCPFREGNNDQFRPVVRKLIQKLTGAYRDPSNFDIGYARIEARKDAVETGDFACHSTVYDENMGLRDPSHHRQCPGATAIHRAGVLMHKVEPKKV